MKKIVVAIIAVFMLAGCGFSPLYGTLGQDKEVTADLGNVSIGNIPDREGQYLRNALMDRIYNHGRPGQARYTLNVTPILESKSDLDITKTATTTREQIRLTTTITLNDLQTGKQLLTRDLISINSFNVLQSQYDTRVSEESVRENALDDLADQIERQLALYFKREK